jgi:hypothetical protein
MGYKSTIFKKWGSFPLLSAGEVDTFTNRIAGYIAVRSESCCLRSRYYRRSNLSTHAALLSSNITKMSLEILPRLPSPLA